MMTFLTAWISSVTTDDISDTKGCTLPSRPEVMIIPPKRNAREPKRHDPDLQARNEALRTGKRFGRAHWKK